MQHGVRDRRFTSALISLLAMRGAAIADEPHQNPSGPPNAVPPEPAPKPAPPPPPPPPLFAAPELEVPEAPKTVRAAPREVEPRIGLWHAEVHAGLGLSSGGSGSSMNRRLTPLTIEAIAAFAFEDDPPLALYGGLAVETIDRNTAGGTFGITYRPFGDAIRLSGGGRWMVAPEGLLGATASVGMCRPHRAWIDLCGDVQLTSYFAGSDLAKGHAVTQAQFLFGVVFDAH